MSLLRLLASCAGQGLALGAMGQGAYEIIRVQDEKDLARIEGVSASEAAWIRFRENTDAETFDRAVRCQHVFDHFIGRPPSTTHMEALRRPQRRSIKDVVNEFVRRQRREKTHGDVVDAEFTVEGKAA